MTRVHPLDHNRHGPRIDDMRIQRRILSICPSPRVTIDRFRSLETLDLAVPEIVRILRIRDRRSNTRSKKINLVLPLYVPYGALDVRLEEPLHSEKKHADLYTRHLPYALMARRAVKESKTLVIQHRRGIGAIALTLCLISIPVLWYIQFAIRDGYTHLLSLSTAHDIESVRSSVAWARDDFERANFLFTPFSWIPIGLIDVADRASQGGLAVTRALDSVIKTFPAQTGSLDMHMTSSATQATPSYRADSRDFYLMDALGIVSPTDWIKSNTDTLKYALSELSDAGSIYAGAQGKSSYAIKMRDVWQMLSGTTRILDQYFVSAPNILQMLGDADPTRYIVFNQNRDEIRANGGFPGSIVSFTLYKGNIIDYRTDDVYYYDWNLYPLKTVPPPGIALLTDNYGLRDVNYYPDFRETLDKANNFVERSGDATITTGIAINQWLIEDILAQVGPVTVSGVTIPFDANNFSLLMSVLVESKIATDNTPKDALFQFIHALGAKIVETKRFDAVLNSIIENWESWQILIASRDDTVEAFLSKIRPPLPWETETRNWAYPIFTSVSGNKSDRYLTRIYSGETRHVQGCTYEDTVTISNQDTYNNQDKVQLVEYMDALGITDPDTRTRMVSIQGDAPNNAFVRLYVPAGSELTTTGWEISTETLSGATVFSWLMNTPVWATSSKTLHYATTIPDCTSYTGSVQFTIQPWLRQVKIDE